MLLRSAEHDHARKAVERCRGEAAIDYFAALPRRRWVRMRQSATVPQTILPGLMRF